MSLPHVTCVNESDDIVVVGPVGEFDIAATDLLRAAFVEAFTPERHKVVVDLSGTTFIDSMVLGVLIAAGKQASGRGGWMRLVAPPTNIRRVLRLTEVDKVFGLYDTVDEALLHGSASSVRID